MAARYVAETDDIESKELATRQMKDAANWGGLAVSWKFLSVNM